VSRTWPIARYLDPGWLFLAAGLGLLISTVLIPAFEALNQARWQRDCALAVERHRMDRLDRYHRYLAALEADNPDLLLSLAMTQLNAIPADQRVLPTSSGSPSSASVFPQLEPPPIELPGRRRVGSLLERLATDERTRLWLIVAGGVCVLVGLLPGATTSHRDEDEDDDDDDA